MLHLLPRRNPRDRLECPLSGKYILPRMSTIKFLHLKVGQQFEYRDQHYTKVSPLIASNNADGAQKMIPRSAAVLVPDGEVITKESKKPPPPPALAVLERYHQIALAELNSLGDDEAKLGAARARLEGLKEELARAISQK